MKYAQTKGTEQISTLWGVANDLIEEYGKIMAPIVFLGYNNESRFAMLDGGNFETQEEFVSAIHMAMGEIEAKSAMMIASAKVTTHSDQDVSEGNEVVLLFYRTEGLEIQQVATIKVNEDSSKTLGKIKDLKQLVKNKFLDGLFEMVH